MPTLFVHLKTKQDSKNCLFNIVSIQAVLIIGDNTRIIWGPNPNDYTDVTEDFEIVKNKLSKRGLIIT